MGNLPSPSERVEECVVLSNDPYTVPKVSRRGTCIKGGVSSCDVRGGGPKDFFFGGGGSLTIPNKGLF